MNKKTKNRNTGHTLPGPALFMIVAGFLLLAPLPDALAERYLTEEQARLIGFPEADRFQSEIIELTDAQAKAVEAKTGAAVHQRKLHFQIAWKSMQFLGIYIPDDVPGKHEIIRYGAFIAADGKLSGVEILEYNEKYGGQIRNASWRDQFKGKSVDSPVKLNSDISSVSGATISCRNVTDGLRRLLSEYDQAIRPRLDALGARP